MKLKVLIFCALYLFVSLFAFAEKEANSIPENLKIEGQMGWIVSDADNIRLSWEVSLSKNSSKIIGYELWVANSPKHLKNEKNLVGIGACYLLKMEVGCFSMHPNWLRSPHFGG